MTTFDTEFDQFCTRFGQPARIELMLCDINAILRGKWLPGAAANKIENGGARLPLSTYVANILGEEVSATGLGIAVGDPDGILVPVPGSLKPVPWANQPTAQVQVEMTGPDGQVSSLSTREVLKSVLDRLAERRLRPVVATELEFYLVQPREDPNAPPLPPVRSPLAQNYNLDVLDRQEHLLTEILLAANEQGLATDTLIAEYGPGQFEINFHHTEDVLAAAETALMFRRLVRGVARKHGLEATFMAKPYADFPGNGMHAHVSLLDRDGSNVFSGDGAQIAPALRDALAGVLDSMRDLQAIFAPHMNSYRRFQVNSFAPAAPQWGFDNRSAAVRLPETQGPAARLEHRISGADVNPYLALAGILGGILHGLDTEPDLPLPLDDPKARPTEPLEHDWSRAVDRFARSRIAETIYGTEFQETYVTVRRDEIGQLSPVISPLEYRTYLSAL